MARGTAIQISSITTAGAIISRADARVCSVAMGSSRMSVPKEKGGPSRRMEDGPRGETALLYVTALHHFARGKLLRVGESLIDGHLSSEGGGELLANSRANALELWDRHELHADIGNFIDSRMRRVGGLDRLQRHFRKRCGLVVLWVLVERGPRSRGHVGPAFLLGDEREIVFAGCPGDELLGGFLLL